MEAATVLPTRIEREAGQSLSAAEIFEITALREMKLSRLLMLYIGTGLGFMLLPGTFLGVWNLISISAHRSASSVSPAWIQAHGHAQIFGWIGTFILGIGFHSIPKLRRTGTFGLWAPWTCWALWTSGVTLRWLTTVYQWHWRALMPLSAVMELAAFLIFLRAVSGHRPQDAGKSKFEEWTFAVIAGAVGFFVSLLMNFGVALFLALRGASPELPHRFDQSLLVFQTWGFLVPFVWGFSAKWLPVFLGLRPVRGRRLLWAVGSEFIGSVDLSVLDQGNRRPSARRNRHCDSCPALDGTCGAAGENQGSPLQLPPVHTPGLLLGHGCRDPGNLGRVCGGRRRHLGRIASCPDCRLSQHDGVCDWPESPSGIFRNAPAVQYEIDVPGPPPSYCRMLDAGQLGSSGLSGTAPVSMVVAASFRPDRNERRYAVCAELVCHIC